MSARLNFLNGDVLCFASREMRVRVPPPSQIKFGAEGVIFIPLESAQMDTARDEICGSEQMEMCPPRERVFICSGLFVETAIDEVQ